ncbi:MAG: GNAT family N-acetyltransferase [Erysipelotrichaceae bacterium]|nr:GNAT family N-acetyltransferase [Erysipelotrichaceae bacterium]
MKIEDYAQVYALWKSCKGMGLNNVDDSKEGIERFLKRNPTTCFVYEIDTTIVGVILAGNDGRRGTINHLAVSDNYRRQGIATKLVDTALSALQQEGITKVNLVVFSRNADGNAFWEAVGFSAREDLTYRNKALVEMIRYDS